jgi:hypothetical protein
MFHFPMSITFITRVSHALVLVSAPLPLLLVLLSLPLRKLRVLPLYKRAIVYLVSSV